MHGIVTEDVFYQSTLDVMPVPIMSSFPCPGQYVRLVRSVFANCSGVRTTPSILRIGRASMLLHPTTARMTDPVYTAHSAVHRGISRRRRSRAACTPCIHHPTRHTHGCLNEVTWGADIARTTHMPACARTLAQRRRER
jgi:hypothetical protein